MWKGRGPGAWHAWGCCSLAAEVLALVAWWGAATDVPKLFGGIDSGNPKRGRTLTRPIEPDTDFT